MDILPCYYTDLHYPFIGLMVFYNMDTPWFISQIPSLLTEPLGYFEFLQLEIILQRTPLQINFCLLIQFFSLNFLK